MPNIQPLPPLKSLHIFSIASQSKSFSDAAEALFITQSAVSHQIKKLESFLGVKLFDRSGTHTVLTEEGTQLANAVNQSFSLISNTVGDLMNQPEGKLIFGVYSAFAVHCLTPALNDLLEKHPQLDIQLKMLQRGDPISGLELDVILTDKPIEDISYQSICLKQESYYPVINNKLYSSEVTLELILKNGLYKLIDLPGATGWTLWSQKHGAAFASNNVMEFSHSILMIQAAIAGQGVALLGESLITRELANKSLIKLSDSFITLPNDGYYFSYHKQRNNDPNVTLLRNWVMSLLSVDTSIP